MVTIRCSGAAIAVARKCDRQLPAPCEPLDNGHAAPLIVPSTGRGTGTCRTGIAPMKAAWAGERNPTTEIAPRPLGGEMHATTADPQVRSADAASGLHG
jgi:hypothetical protein